MKSKLTTIVGAVQALAALVLIGAIKIWAPVCQKMLTLTTGKEVHMKCFYTAQAALGVAVIALVAAIVVILASKDHKKVQFVNIACGVVLFLLFTSLIGVCASPDMACRTTAVWGKVVAGVTVIASVVDLLSGKEGQIPG